MMSWYEIIKQQWQMGLYSDPSQLDIYVKAGWITAEQKEEIINYKEPVPDNYPWEPGYGPNADKNNSDSTESDNSTTESDTTENVE